MINNIPLDNSKDSGIYIIKNTINNKTYIGSTTHFRLRYNKHYFELSSGKHPSKHLLASYQKNGKNTFTFDILEIINQESFRTKELFEKHIIARENYFINKYKSNNNSFGYNLRIAAETNRGIKHSEDALTRLKGKKLSKETINKMSLSRIGEKHHSAILNEKDVKLIKLLIYNDFRNINIAKYLNVNKSVVNDIKNNGSWKHIVISKKDIANFEPSLYTLDNKSRLDKSSVLLIKYLLWINISKPIITEFTGVSYSTIKGIQSGKIYNKFDIKKKDLDYFNRNINKKDLLECEIQHKTKIEIRRKSLSLKGSSNPASKLTESEVIQIVKLLKANKSLKYISEIFKVGIHSISKIKTGQNWANLTGFDSKKKGILKGENHPNVKHTDEVALKIIKLSKIGKTTKEICDLLNLEKTFVNRIKSGKTRTYLFKK